MGTKDARIYTRRNDRDGRARAANRRAAFDKWWASSETRRQFWEASDTEVEAAFHAGWLAAAEAGDESVDGVHPRDEEG